MELKLNIENSFELDNTFIKTFENLSDEDKKQLTLNVFNKWVSEPIAVNPTIADEWALNKLKESNDSIWVSNNGYKKARDHSDEVLRRSTEYSDLLKKYKSPKQVFFEEVNKEIIKHFKLVIDERLKTDPEIEKIMDAVFGEIKKNFKSFVQEAMNAYFAKHMEAIGNLMFNSMNTNNRVNNLEQTLNSRLQSGLI